MKLTTLSELIWVTYQEGRVNATMQTFGEQDIRQQTKIAYSAVLRSKYNQDKKNGETDETYLISQLLSTKKFKLGDVDMNGRRRADISGNDFYRLPHNAHMVNVTPYGQCGDDRSVVVSQLKSGEETFFFNPKFSNFYFYVVKGYNIDTYNLPQCVEGIEIETTFVVEDADVSLDMAFDIVNYVLGVVLKISGFGKREVDNPYSEPQLVMRQKLSAQSQQNQ